MQEKQDLIIMFSPACKIKTAFPQTLRWWSVNEEIFSKFEETSQIQKEIHKNSSHFLYFPFIPSSFFSSSLLSPAVQVLDTFHCLDSSFHFSFDSYFSFWALSRCCFLIFPGWIPTVGHFLLEFGKVTSRVPLYVRLDGDSVANRASGSAIHVWNV